MTGAQVAERALPTPGARRATGAHINSLQRHTAMVPVLWHVYVGTVLALVRIMARSEDANISCQARRAIRSA